MADTAINMTSEIAFDKIARWCSDIMPRGKLSSTAKLLYIRLDWHQGDNGDAFPSLRKLAKELGRGVSSIQSGLDELVEAGMIRRTSGTNRGPKVVNRYEVMRTTSDAHQMCSAPKTNSAAHQEPPHKHTNETDHRERESGKAKKPSPKAIEEIYSAYPKHVAKGPALQAIGKALKAITGRAGVPDPAAWLLDRVQAFAKSPAGQAGRFTPHPATWFNAARYDDDPAAWTRQDSNIDGGGAPKKQPLGRVTAAAGKYERIDAAARARGLASKAKAANPAPACPLPKQAEPPSKPTDANSAADGAEWLAALPEAELLKLAAECRRQGGRIPKGADGAFIKKVHGEDLIRMFCPAISAAAHAGGNGKQVAEATV